MNRRQRVAEITRVLGQLVAGETGRRFGRDRDEFSDPIALEQARAEDLKVALERLGPLYIKVGQLLSTRPDIVSQTVCDAFLDFHEEVMVRPFSEFEPVMAANLGPAWPDRFSEFDHEVPIGAASIAQVYRGVLRDGREVAVKLQRPGVAEATRMDMDILAKVVKLFMKRAPVIAEIFQPDIMLEVVFSAMRTEIDFRVEAGNIDEFRELLKHYGNLRVPEVIEVTKEVLVMSMAPGRSLRDVRLEDFSDKEREAIGRDIVTMVFRGFMVDGVFHGDPHPGNIFVAPGEPATILDFGIIGRIDRATRLGFTRFMLGMALVDGEATGRAAVEMSTLTSRADVGGFLSDMQRWVPTVADVAMEDMEFGKSFNEILVMCTRRGIAMNPAIALFGKATANMEGSLKRIAPEITPFDVFRDSMGSILRDQAKSLMSSEETLRVANEAFFATRSVPEQLRFLAQSVVNGQYVLRIRDEALVAHEAREDARARAMRRTLLSLGTAAIWLDHRRRRS